MPFKSLARIVLCLAVLFTLYMALSPHPMSLPTDQLGDKFAHSFAFATLTVLAVTAFPAMELLRVGERLSLFGALIEVVQATPALHRDCDIFDWVADTLMIALVLVSIALYRRLTQSPDAGR